MGSVIDYIECPHCKSEAYSDHYYKTGEEYINCQNCGYHYSVTYKRDEEGNYVTKDGTDNYDFSNLIVDITEVKNPYGSYHAQVIGDMGSLYGSVRTAEEWEELKAQALANEYDMEYLGISRFVDGEIVVEDVINREEDYNKYVEMASQLEEPDYRYHIDDPQQGKVRVMTKEEYLIAVKQSKQLI